VPTSTGPIETALVGGDDQAGQFPGVRRIDAAAHQVGLRVLHPERECRHGVAMPEEQALEWVGDVTDHRVDGYDGPLGLAARTVVVEHPFGRLRTAQQLADAHVMEAAGARGLQHRADQALPGSGWVLGQGFMRHLPNAIGAAAQTGERLNRHHGVLVPRPGDAD